MKLAIVTDSTCDLSADELSRLDVRRVPLYVSFRGETYRDWLELTPKEIIEGVQAGADLPTTSQPSPQDFEAAYEEAKAAGAEEILCITISSDLSGTFQSANLAKGSVGIPVTLFDSRAASIGLGEMVKKAAALRDSGASTEEIVRALESIRDSNMPLFTVATLDFLQKGGRIGRAAALMGGLLNIKPILSLENGKIVPLGRARGNKKALAELVNQVRKHRERFPGKLVVNFLHVQDPEAAEQVRAALEREGIRYEGGQVYEIGAVVASHVGPGTYGLYMHAEPAER
ncbi:MAG TPA: DegV family protein [Trueperaceae bacterium]